MILVRYFSQSWLVLVLAMVFGGALAGMHVAVSDKIRENKLNETLSQIPELVPGAETGEPMEIDGVRVYRALKDGQTAGWVVPASGQGFADTIEILVGLDGPAEKITGVYILDQKETPGLGNKILEEIWRGQFAGKRTDQPLVLTKTEPSGQQIESITGATISSETVVDVVNRKMDEIRDILAAKGKG